jgi:HlyD family secretion protein
MEGAERMKALARFVKIILILAAIGLAVWQGPGLYRQWFPDGSSASGAKVVDPRFHTVARGTLRIGLVEDGRLRAVKHHKISPELNGRAKISWIVAQGAKVAKGDKLVEFEKKPFEEAITLQETALQTANRELTVAEESLKIEQSTGKSTLAGAETRLKEARDGLKKYRELEAPQQFKKIEADAVQTREKVLQAQQALSAQQAKADEQLFNDEEQKKSIQAQIISAKDGLKSARKAVEGAVLQQKMWKAYDYPRMLDSKKEAVANAELELAKAEVGAKSQLLQRESAVEQIKDRIRRSTTELDDLKKELDKCIVMSPVDGIVLYGDPAQRGYYNRGDGDMEIKVGAEWYRGNTLITIPDLSAFEADIAIGEEYRGRIKPGSKASVTLEAVPGLILEGALKEIAGLARPRVPWDESTPKVFDGIIALAAADPRMVSGMTARVEIIAETVENVIHTPIEAVFNVDGKPVCFVRQGSGYERRAVKPGRSNDDFVEITEGLAEGEQVYVFNPAESGAKDHAKSAAAP